eukprot:1012150-Pelagomonas_calceolata.AAC.6
MAMNALVQKSMQYSPERIWLTHSLKWGCCRTATRACSQAAYKHEEQIGQGQGHQAHDDRLDVQLARKDGHIEGHEGLGSQGPQLQETSMRKSATISGSGSTSDSGYDMNAGAAAKTNTEAVAKGGSHHRQ